MSNQERTLRLEELFRSKATIEGEIAVHLGEVERSQSFRDEGATSTESWVAERFGVATSTARSLTLVGQKAWDLPHLIGAACAGDVSLDKVKVLAEVATSESEEELCEEAKRHSLRELADIARTTTTRRSTNPAALTSAEQHGRRFVRFNDQFRTVTAQLPAESYAEAKACLEARAKAVPTEGELPGTTDSVTDSWG